jgi:two-component system, LytTR family, response regulator
MTAIAIDDEPAALEIIERHADKIPFIELKKAFTNTAEALGYIYQQKIDLIFLDIQMPDMLGTEFAKMIQNRNISIIFTTAYSEYAVDGFQLQALDYLLKPIEFSRFMQACNRAYEKISKRDGSSAIFIKDGFEWLRVNLDDVLYMQSDTNLIFIHEKNRKISTRMTIIEMMGILPKDKFIRVHKSYIVAEKAIHKIERHQISVSNITIPLAGTYKAMIEERLLR